MQRTYRVPLARVGWIGLTVVAIVLAHPGTSIAGAQSESTRAGAATVLQRGAGYADAGERRSVRALQSALRELGRRPGPVDGLFGPRTDAAVRRLQGTAGLAVDGVAGPRTRRAMRALRAGRLRRGAGYARRHGSERVRRLQRELARRGLSPGPVDGRFGPQTERAVAALQQGVGLPASGAVDRQTRRVLARGATPAARTERMAGSKRRASAPSEVPPLPRSPLPAAAPEPDGVPLAGAALAAAVLFVLGGIAGLVLARGRAPRGEIAVPVSPGVIAEGEAPSVGRFRGPVEVVVLARRRFVRGTDPHYLVHAPAETSPFWVGQSDITRLVAPGYEPDPSGEPALGYAAVGDPAPEGPSGLADQASAIDSHCEERGWRLLEVVHDVDDGNGAALERPGLRYALDRLGRGEATCLVVARLDHVSGSAPELERVVEAVRRKGGRLVVMDVGLDTGETCRPPHLSTVSARRRGNGGDAS